MAATSTTTPSSTIPSPAAAIARIVPTTEAQREIWLGDRLGREASLAYNESVRCASTARSTTQALRAALADLVDRHEALRATVSPDGTQLLIGGAAPRRSWPSTTSRGLERPRSERRLRRRGRAPPCETPFDLEQRPAVPRRAARGSPPTSTCSSHRRTTSCATAGRSACISRGPRRSSTPRRSARGPRRPCRRPRFGDYAAWRPSEAAQPGDAGATTTTGCRSFVAAALPVLDLPLDRPRPAVRTFSSCRIDHLLDAALVDALRKLGREHGTSLFATLLGGFAALLHRLTGQDDLVVGIPAAGPDRRAASTLVGHCVNLLPLRVAVDVAAGRSTTLVRQSRSALLDAYEHQTLHLRRAAAEAAPRPRPEPAAAGVGAVQPRPDAVRRRRQPSRASTVRARAQSRATTRTSSCSSTSRRSPAGMRLECQYNTDLFDARPSRAGWRATRRCCARPCATPARRSRPLDMLRRRRRAPLRALQPAPTPLARDAADARLLRGARRARRRTRAALRDGDAR